jgi:hypothetical protein
VTQGRITCSVPGCKNSSARWFGCAWYLCSLHWRATPSRFRRLRGRVYRALIKRGEVRHDDRTYYRLTDRAVRVGDAVERRLVRAAIAAAAGL